MPPSRMRLGALATLVFGGMSLILGMELLPSARAVESPCFSDPTQPDCSDASSYYPDEAVMGDVSSFCNSNPTDSACSLWRICKADNALSRSSPYCDAWSLLHSACARKKESLQQDCVSFNLLCGDIEKTAVSQCVETRHAGVPNLIPPADASAAVAKLCAEMPDMDGCSACSASYCADPLLSLGKICSSMNMDGCEGWTTMCTGVPSGSLGEICGSEGSETCSGVMQMYFHTGLNDYILFKEWVPCTTGRYAFSVVGIILSGILVAFLKAYRIRLEHAWSAPTNHQKDDQGRGAFGGGGDDSREVALLPGAEQSSSGRRHSDSRREGEDGGMGPYLPESGDEWRQNTVRALLGGMIMTIDYMLMLIAMTFNVGLVVAVILGTAMGLLLLGHTGARRRRGGREGPVAMLVESECCGDRDA